MMPTKILVVDDEADMQELIELRFRHAIRKKEVEFFFAPNGDVALQVLAREADIYILLCDINMPVMDGLSLLREVKTQERLLKTIMVTAYGNMSNIRTSMNEGAFDFVTKPIDFSDLKATITKAVEEVIRQQEGDAAKKQLPLTQKALEETDQRAQYLEELDQLKAHFFTNLSHEFRTPLTVILGMSKQIAEDPERWLKQGNELIRRNSYQLLDLVNQILDLRKLESNQLHLNLRYANILVDLNYIVSTFQSYADTQSVSLHYQAEAEAIWMDYDSEKILRIVSNLLSNAIKFTPTGGAVVLSIEVLGDTLKLSVSDTGIGILEAQLPHIFDRFYQVDSSSTRTGEGTGIGLALVKELVHLMKGEITATSKPDKGTVFTVELPITRSAQADTGAAQASRSSAKSSLMPFPMREEGDKPTNRFGAAELPHLLVVEDNADVVAYLIACLEEQYHIIVAHDGQEGIDMALEYIPDLIMSDVMMPRRNGFELLETLRGDVRTSHIPIVLLTAKADQPSRISGLSKGADAYLTKPFDQEELLVKLDNLLSLRRRLQERYAQLSPLNSPPEPNFKQEDQFIKELYQIIETHLSDAEFNVPTLSKMLGMSRSSLHRKLKALTDLTPNTIINKIRLQKSKELVISTTLPVADVAYQLGFNDPAYFSRSFAREFGESPRSMRAHAAGERPSSIGDE